MTFGRRIRLGFATAGLFAAAVAVFDMASDRHTVRSALNLHAGALPTSVAQITCETPFTTDVLTSCFFRVEPSDIRSLLAGYSFTESSQTSVVATSEVPLPSDFAPSMCFVAEPPEFEHGGLVFLCPDARMGAAFLYLYIE